MKRIIFLLTTIFMCTIAYAETIDIDWLVGNSVYNQSTCEYGGDLIVPTAPTKYGYTFNGWVSYTPIEYLESTGTQYIDTGYIPNNLTRTEVEVRFSLPTIRNGSGIIFGANGKNSAHQINFGDNSPNSIYSWICLYRITPNCNPFPIGVQTDLTTGKNTIILDAKNEFISYGHLIQTLSAQKNAYNIDVTMYLFAYHSISLNGTETVSVQHLYSSMAIYSAKIYDNDVLVRDFIPVLDLDGVPCMFDKVEGKFYYNAGTGDFIAGPAIGE